MRSRRNVQGGLQFGPIMMVHVECGGSKNTVHLKPHGVRCVQHVNCLNMLQGQILPRLVGSVFTLFILRGWLYSCVGHSVKQRLVHVS